jgi:hypothetical protein
MKRKVFVAQFKYFFFSFWKILYEDETRFHENLKDEEEKQFSFALFCYFFFSKNNLEGFFGNMNTQAKASTTSFKVVL